MLIANPIYDTTLKYLRDNPEIANSIRRQLELEELAYRDYDNVFGRLERQLEQKNKALEEKDQALIEKDHALIEHKRTIEDKDKALEENKKNLEESKKTIAAQEQLIRDMMSKLGK